ncbi:MAG: DNA-directed RNA polymerase sigma-70 factor [Planctomycetaceae bacterium]|nr:MAG: DNA-directed RNA polymerase sigma-70 factor [Planctomycetaceae bacterium]
MPTSVVDWMNTTPRLGKSPHPCASPCGLSDSVVSHRQKKTEPRSRLSSQQQLLRKARKLASCEIAYVPHPSFCRKDAEAWLARMRPEGLDLAREPVSRLGEESGIAFLSGLVRERLLTPSEEKYLFLHMNYCKYRAEIMRRQIDPQKPQQQLITAVERLLLEALACRDRLVLANMRLVVSVAHKLSDQLDQLGELVGEGLLPLIRAVELFDVSRGYRFSTYATWAVRNQMVRQLKRHRVSHDKTIGIDQQSWENIPDHHRQASPEEQPLDSYRDRLQCLISQLSAREQLILSARFGLNGQPEGLSLSEIAEMVHLSKERVRQIILHALEQLRQAMDPALHEAWAHGELDVLS